MVYIVGLPFHLNDIELLASTHFLGQYGQIQNLSTNFKPGMGQSPQYFMTHVTYSLEEEAATAILALDGLKVNHNTLQATFGMTKFCNKFIKGMKCRKQNCLYTHEPVLQQFCQLTDDLRKNKLPVVSKQNMLETIV